MANGKWDRSTEPCSFPGCGELIRVKSVRLCQKHYSRWKKHGDPGVRVPPGKKIVDDYELILTRITVTDAGCWEYTGSIDKYGYGFLGPHREKPHRRLVHRIMWAKANGVTDLSSKILICHHCDNPPCCNPDHLFSGSHADNTRDMVEKVRFGVSNRKLTNSQIRTIRWFLTWNPHLAGSYSFPNLSDLGRAFGVNSQVIADIRNHKTWKHIK